MREFSRASYISLFSSYAVSFLAVGLCYVFYSRILTPAEFGLYSIALTISAVGIFLLDGGLKTAIVKDPAPLAPRSQGVLLSWLLMISLLLTACTGPSGISCPPPGAITCSCHFFR